MSFWNQPKPIFLAVAAAHAALLLAFAISKAPQIVDIAPPRLIVSTVKLQPKPKPKPRTAAPKPTAVLAKTPKPKAAEPKPTPVLAKTPKKSKHRQKKEKKKRAKPKSSDPDLAKLARDAQNSISRIADKVGGKKKSAEAAPLEIDRPLVATYERELAERLRLLLKLPEFGSVRVALTLNREGRVVEVQILATESPANREYVLAQLDRQTLAPFGNHFPGEAKRTFRLTLDNEI